MDVPQIVIDTNVLVSALRSRRGSSYRLLQLIDSGRYEANLSVPLFLEYEETSKRLVSRIRLTEGEVDAILDYICRKTNHHAVSFLWRPFSKDPEDDMVLELAVAAGCDAIVTYNRSDYRGVEDQFGIRILTPREFLEEIGELP